MSPIAKSRIKAIKESMIEVGHTASKSYLESGIKAGDQVLVKLGLGSLLVTTHITGTLLEEDRWLVIKNGTRTQKVFNSSANQTWYGMSSAGQFAAVLAVEKHSG